MYGLCIFMTSLPPYERIELLAHSRKEEKKLHVIMRRAGKSGRFRELVAIEAA